MTTYPRTYILLPSGVRLDLCTPDPDAWEDRELATRLGQTIRWAGASRWTRPMSVAQHSLLVLWLRDRMNPQPTNEERLHALLHDAEEGFLGFDPITPLKAILGQPLRDICNRLQQAIRHRYDLEELPDQQKALLKAADIQAASLEALHVAGWTLSEIKSVLELPPPIMRRDPLYGGAEREEGYEPWEPWEPAVATRQFSDMLQILMTRKRIREREET